MTGGLGRIKNARPGRERWAGVLLTVEGEVHTVSRVWYSSATPRRNVPDREGQSRPNMYIEYHIFKSRKIDKVHKIILSTLFIITTV